MYGTETSPWFDQSVTSIGGERTNSLLVCLDVTLIQSTDFREEQGFCGKKPTWNAFVNKTWQCTTAFTFALEVAFPSNPKMHPDVTTGWRQLQTPKRFIHHFHISHNALYLPPKILHKPCFQFLLGRCNSLARRLASLGTSAGRMRNIIVGNKYSEKISGTSMGFMSLLSKDKKLTWFVKIFLGKQSAKSACKT